MDIECFTADTNEPAGESIPAVSPAPVFQNLEYVELDQNGIILLSGVLKIPQTAIRSVRLGYVGAELSTASIQREEFKGRAPQLKVEAAVTVPSSGPSTTLIGIVNFADGTSRVEAVTPQPARSSGIYSSATLDPGTALSLEIMPSLIANAVKGSSSIETETQMLRSVLAQNRRTALEKARLTRLAPQPAVHPISFPHYIRQTPEKAGYSTSLDVCLVTSEILGPDRNGETATFYTSLGKILAKGGHRVTILYTGDSIEGGSFDYWKAFYQTLNIRLCALPPAISHVRGAGGRRRSYQVYEWLKQRSFNWIHFHEMCGVGYFSVRARRQGTAFANTVICVGVHAPTYWHHENNHQFRYENRLLDMAVMERETAAGADVVYCSSQTLLNRLRKEGWQFPDSTWILAPPLSDQLQQSGSARSSGPITELVFYGDLETRKGLSLFADTLDRLAELSSPPPVQITFLGRPGRVEGESAREFLDRRSRHWPFAVRLLTNYNRENTLEYLQRPNLLVVIPSLADINVYTLNDCATLRIPCLVSRGSGIDEVLDEREAEEVLFEPTPQSFADKILAALDNPPTAKLRYSPEITAPAWLSFHNDLSVFTNEPRQEEPPEPNAAPLVSICIPHRNRPELLLQVLKSAEEQEHSRIEALVVDDGSDMPGIDQFLDDLPNRFPGLELTVLRQPRSYPSAARNLAAVHARGEYLLLVDDDNLIKPHAITTMLRAMKRTGAAFCTCTMEIFAGKEAPQDNRGSYLLPFIGHASEHGFWSNSFGDTFMLCRRDAYIRIGGFSEDRSAHHEDWQVLARAFIGGYYVDSIAEPLYWYRYSPDGLNSRANEFLGHLAGSSPFFAQLNNELHLLFHTAKGMDQHFLDFPSRQPRDEDLDPSALETYFQLSRDVLFALDAESGFSHMTPLDNVTLLNEPNSLAFRAHNGDPQFILRLPDIPTDNDILVFAHLESPAPSHFQIFYRTKHTPYYTEGNSVRAFTRQGTQELYLRIPNKELTGELRIDPGAVPGDYRIIRLEIRIKDDAALN